MTNPTDSQLKDMLKAINDKDGKVVQDFFQTKKKSDKQILLDKVDAEIKKAQEVKLRLQNSIKKRFQKLKTSAYKKVDQILKAGEEAITAAFKDYEDRAQFDANMDKHLENIKSIRTQLIENLSMGEIQEVVSFVQSLVPIKKQFQTLKDIDLRYNFTAEWNLDQVSNVLKNLLFTNTHEDEKPKEVVSEYNQQQKEERKEPSVSSILVNSLMKASNQIISAQNLKIQNFIAEIQKSSGLNLDYYKSYSNIIQPLAYNKSVYIVNIFGNQYIKLDIDFQFPLNMGLIQDGNVLYIVGGYINNAYSKKCYNYTPQVYRNCPKEIASLNTQKSHVTLLKLDEDRIGAIGGYKQGVTLEQCQFYSISQNQWVKCSYHLNIGRQFPGACIVGGYIYVFGG